MKKIFFASFVFLCLSDFSYAQWTSGTNISNTNSGNVGIGTTATNGKFTVAGIVLLSGGSANIDHNATNISFLNNSGQALIAWNFSAGVGETDLISNKGGGSDGGFTFINNDNAGNTLSLLRLSGSGNVGIGDGFPVTGFLQPAFPLHIKSSNSTSLAVINSSISNDATSGEVSMYFGDNYSGVNMLRASKRTFNTRAFEIWTEYGKNGNYKAADFYHDYLNFYTNNANRLTIDVNGNVGIGQAAPQNKLDVAGTIHAQAVKVDMNGWSDFALKPSYTFRSLKEVDRYIKQNNHLPDVPSEQEVAKNGIDLAEMNKKLLQKIEELTLYLIEKDKRDFKKQLQISKQQIQINKLTFQVKTLLNFYREKQLIIKN